MKKTYARLADGREIIYFDESDDARRRLLDSRDLVSTAPASEIRFDPLRREWVAMAAHRQGRTHLPPADDCPLCPSDADRRSEIPSDSYDVVTFENRFPSLAFDPGAGEGVTDELSSRQPGAGRCEVLCFSSEHDASFVDLSPSRVRTVVEAWSDRTQALSGMPHVEQVFCFENRGQEIGVTLHHPHGQIYAYPFITPRTQRELDSAHRHRERTRRNLFADVLAAEQRDEVRVVRRTEHWTAFVPAAARWPLEVHLYPNRHVPDLPALTDAERDDFCHVYLDVLGRMDAVFGQRVPYVSAWHQAPVRFQRDLSYLHLELFSIRRAAGKLKYLAGSEAAMGVFVNDVLPETTAHRLREAV
ncbi:galactose-1-phosphate uridylyltransferase [Saccharopolyspora erythraea]|uniref:galactose-1-phosphate uridylyltransferase n=1 Tax=Saccharopolyspora erythraea TaxID=1836 RepID=UPI001BA88590|nr:galactose-1-phosphate uridylyltransferase [Saccharopolyspora erythraea]QUH01994.1 galactose-1-phosphate uridylyltransferase [Saccharopolyspora erythraea]